MIDDWWLMRWTTNTDQKQWWWSWLTTIMMMAIMKTMMIMIDHNLGNHEEDDDNDWSSGKEQMRWTTAQHQWLSNICRWYQPQPSLANFLFQVLNGISKEHNSTVVLPIPKSILRQDSHLWSLMMDMTKIYVSTINTMKGKVMNMMMNSSRMKIETSVQAFWQQRAKKRHRKRHQDRLNIGRWLQDRLNIRRWHQYYQKMTPRSTKASSVSSGHAKIKCCPIKCYTDEKSFFF